MKKVLIIYNPASGNCLFPQNLDWITAVCLELGYLPVFYRIDSKLEMSRLFEDIESYSLLLISGGDGTVSRTLNLLFRSGKNIPVGIIPSGTANDFATTLGIEGHPVDITRKLLSGRQLSADTGQVNDRFFINVVSAGILTTISQEVNNIIKKNLGVTAYYLKGIQHLWNIAPLSLNIESDTLMIKDEIMLFMVMNSSTAGTFKNIAPSAGIRDGLLDVLLLKKCTLSQLITVLLEAHKGKGLHLRSPLVKYFQARWVKVSSPKGIKTDVDGEPGPELPLEIKVLPGQLTLLVPQ